MIYYYPSDYDHTTGCYATDYVLSAVLTAICAISLLCPLRNKAMRDIMFRISMGFGCFLAMLYSVLGGIVHQLFLDANDYVVYSVMWAVALMCGSLGFVLVGYACYLIYYEVRLVTSLVFGAIALVMAILPFVSTFALEMLTACTFLLIVIFVVSAIMLLRAQKLAGVSNEKGEKVFFQTRNYFAISALGLVLMIVAAGCQMFKASMNPAFNYNAIYHILSSIGFPLLFLPPILLINTSKTSTDVEGGALIV